MIDLRHSRVDRFASALFAALGLTSLAACDGDVAGDGAGGGGGGDGSGPSVTSGNGASTTASGPGVPVHPCVDPQPLLVDGLDVGVDQCADGGLRRREAIACPVLLPREDPTCVGTGECAEDSDCAGATATCEEEPGNGICSCRTGCTTDDDCGEGLLCLCGDPVGRCVVADCRSGDDCGAGLDCRSHDPEQGCGGIQFACQTSADTCGGDGDCAGGYCNVQEDGHRECVDGGCAIGRPFLVDGSARVAPTTRRMDWGCALLPDVDALPPSLRAELARRWTLVAQMEHASIAAFARFSLQLLALGAPADLIERTNQALVDETAHARAAFALASAYAGRPIGPDGLALDGALGATVDLVDLVRLVVREGCVGETLAAIEASEAEGRCVDPVVRRVLARIAVEEGRHAELAWRTVRWALDAGETRVRQALTDELARLRAEVEVTPPPTTNDADERLLAWGCVTDGLRAVVRASALERVVLPALGAMLDDAARRAA